MNNRELRRQRLNKLSETDRELIANRCLERLAEYLQKLKECASGIIDAVPQIQACISSPNRRSSPMSVEAGRVQANSYGVGKLPFVNLQVIFGQLAVAVTPAPGSHITGCIEVIEEQLPDMAPSIDADITSVEQKQTEMPELWMKDPDWLSWKFRW